MRVLLILFAATAAWAQEPDFAKPIFPTDSVSPQVGQAAQLLESVCPGNVEVGTEITCRGGCEKLPGQVDRSFEGGWRVTSVLRGHFLAGNSDDAVLGTEGCEAHSNEWGGSILLTRTSGAWRQVRYEGGMRTERCHRVRAVDGRDLALCEIIHAAQGNLARQLALEDLNAPKPMWDHPILEVEDTVRSCGELAAGAESPEPAVRAYIERVEFTARGMSVYARYGKRPLTEAELEECGHGRSDFRIPTKPYHIEFLFDGKTYQIATQSRAAARIFEGK